MIRDAHLTQHAEKLPDYATANAASLETPTLRPLSSLPHIEAGMRIGLYGGSFNPVHAGHVAVAAAAMRRLQLHQLWWLISPQNPLKSEPPAATDTRAAAVRSLARHPQYRVLTFEQARQLTYSYQTVNAIQRRKPAAHFVWIMGADSFAELHNWRRWRQLVEQISLAVFDRPGFRYKAINSPAGSFLRDRMIDERHAERLLCANPPAWSYLSFPVSPLSSSQLRANSMAFAPQSPADR